MSTFRFWRDRIRREVDAEVAFHLEARVEELVRQGMSPAEACRQAVTEFGDVSTVKHDLQSIDRRVDRRQRRFEWLDGLRQDLRFAMRAAWRTPVVSLTIVLTLALGVGVNTAMFSLLDVIFLRPPAGVADPDGLHRVWRHARFRSGSQYWPGFPYAAYQGLDAALKGRADLAIYDSPIQWPSGRGDRPTMISVVAASASFLPLVGVTPALGRLYLPDEDDLAAPEPVAVISDALWRRLYGATPDAIGQELVIGGEAFSIIGVTPPGFSGIDLDRADAWVPLGRNPRYGGRTRRTWFRNPNLNSYGIVLRVLAGTGLNEVEQRATLSLRQASDGYRADTATVARFGAIVAARGPGERSPAVRVAERAAIVAALVLVIALANVSNLLLARAVIRRREIAVRLALGISGRRLVRLLVSESVLLALVASVGALVGARFGGALLRRLLMPEVAFASDPLHWRVLALAVVMALGAGLLSGLIPALRARRTDLTRSLKAGTRGSGADRSRLRPFLVATQAALSVVLVVGASLFLQSLERARQTDTGFDVDRLAFAGVSLTGDTATNRRTAMRLLQLEDRIAAVPGVERVAFSSIRPKWGFRFESYHADSPVTGRQALSGMVNAVSPGFFRTTGTKIRRGRTFSEGAAGSGESAVLVNEALADSLWPGGDALDQCIRFGGPAGPCHRVIGVTQNAMVSALRERPEPFLYVSALNPPSVRDLVTDIVVRVPPERATLALATIHDILSAEFPGASVNTSRMTETMEPEYRPWRLGSTLFALFGFLAVLVAAIGVYSAVSYSVTQRTHEFGVRLALGATTRMITAFVTGQGLRVVAAGVAAGIGLALVLGRSVAALLYDVDPVNPLALATGAGVLLVVSVVAALVPAWRAGRADPAAALRAD